MVAIRIEATGDTGAIEHLLETTFGPGRHARSGYLLREGFPFLPSLGFVAHDEADGSLLGSLRFTALVLRDESGSLEPALLLGPLAVVPARQRNGVGLKLMAHGLEAARGEGHDLVFLLGEPAYYERAGFARVTPGDVTMPVPFDPNRLMVRSLKGRNETLIRGRISVARD